jgi:hypothetical protein
MNLTRNRKKINTRASGGPDEQPLRIEKKHYACFRVVSEIDDRYLVVGNQGGGDDDNGSDNGGGGGSDGSSTPPPLPSDDDQQQPSPKHKELRKRHLTVKTKAIARMKSADKDHKNNVHHHKQHNNFVAPSQQQPLARETMWPTTVEEMAQDLLLTLLRGNEKLCLRLADDERQRDSVFDLFAFVANSHGQQQQVQSQQKSPTPQKKQQRQRPKGSRDDVNHSNNGGNSSKSTGVNGSSNGNIRGGGNVGEAINLKAAAANVRAPIAEKDLLTTTCDTSPALEFFFIMCAPTASRPLKDFQARVAER